MLIPPKCCDAYRKKFLCVGDGDLLTHLVHQLVLLARRQILHVHGGGIGEQVFSGHRKTAKQSRKCDE